MYPPQEQDDFQDLLSSLKKMKPHLVPVLCLKDIFRLSQCTEGMGASTIHQNTLHQETGEAECGESDHSATADVQSKK